MKWIGEYNSPVYLRVGERGIMIVKFAGRARSIDNVTLYNNIWNIVYFMFHGGI